MHTHMRTRTHTHTHTHRHMQTHLTHGGTQAVESGGVRGWPLEEPAVAPHHVLPSIAGDPLQAGVRMCGRKASDMGS
jgi:hypothetical protein